MQPEDDDQFLQIYDYISANLSTLAKNQYASRVVEAAVITMPAESFEHLCYNFIDEKGKRTRLFKELLFDAIGNYISTKLIEKAKVYGLTKVNDHFSRTFNDSIDALRKLKHGR